jgi:hypothetical protein
LALLVLPVLLMLWVSMLMLLDTVCSRWNNSFHLSKRFSKSPSSLSTVEHPSE